MTSANKKTLSAQNNSVKHKNKALQPKAFEHKPEQQAGSGVMCSALIIAAPHSGSGKTTVTAALARYHRNQGRKVTVFKVGPDFIDPMILRQASGELVYQLDYGSLVSKAVRSYFIARQ